MQFLDRKHIIQKSSGRKFQSEFRRIFFLILSMLFSVLVFAQSKGTISGKILDEKNRPIEYVNISIPGITGTTSDRNGYYSIDIPAGKRISIIYSHLEYESDTISLTIAPGDKVTRNRNLALKTNLLSTVNIIDKQERANSISRLQPKTIQVIPSASMGIEAILTGQLGVMKGGGELSSQYSVRGGNFDENLVYVNDIEVYRPFLIRSGQQEGLSFTNPDMVSSVLFSAGGFEAKYGDKMSSVLDIRYRKPSSFASSAAISLLGGSAHIEGCSENHRFTHITGFRYKTSKYMLNSLDTKGEYNPSFLDFQTYFTYDVSTDFEISFLGNISQNKYTFVPETLETAWGNINEALQIKIYFDGHEVDQFSSATAAFAGTYHPNSNLSCKIIASAFQTSENETFDIQGQYLINELDRDLGSQRLGDSLMNIGIGTFLNHARNYLDANVFNLAHKGFYTSDNERSFFQWGVKTQKEFINDRINEWQMIDSAGYSLPYSDSEVNLYSTLTAENRMEAYRATAYMQEAYTILLDSSELNLTGGVRCHYVDYNDQLVVSPRMNIAFKPNWKNDILFRFSAGYYYQPPFYKELRNLDGDINLDVKAQKSIHFVLGSDYNFRLWGRPFKYVTEIYYKKLDNIVPYIVDQVRIRYLGENNAHGYAAGIDMKINGEFVKGVDSWASFSLMRTKEDVEGDYYINAEGNKVEIGYVPRPSDQLFNFALFFQDYLPRNPTFKVHLSMMVGSGLPYGPPKSWQNRTSLRMPPYRRVDVGFSKEIVSEFSKLSNGNPLKHFKNIWIGLEVFNLLDIRNTISYLWITDIYSRQLAVPNYLTSRRLNVKIVAHF